MSDLYSEAVAFAEARRGRTFSRQRFQRVLRVGFITRDRLLLELVDRGVIGQYGRDHFVVLDGDGAA